MTTIQKHLKVLEQRCKYVPWIGAGLGGGVGVIVGLSGIGVALFAGVAGVLCWHYCFTEYKEFERWRTLTR
jgi:hypothetical protein